MMKKRKHRQPARVDKRPGRTTVRLLKPIEGRPQTQPGEITVQRTATDRFAVLGMAVHRVEVQPDSTVGLITDAGMVVVSSDDYRKMLDLHLPGGHWPTRMGRLPEPPGATLVSTYAAGELLGVSQAKIVAWLRDGTLQVAGEYENEYGTRCFLLDKAVLDSPATGTALADKIAAYQKRRSAGKQAVTTRVTRQRQHHDQYLEAIGQATAADELRHLLTAAYLLWHLNHRAKREVRVGRTRLYAMKDRMLAALYAHYAGDEYAPISAEHADALRAVFALADTDLTAGGLLIRLQCAGLDASAVPQPAFLVSQVCPAVGSGDGDARQYVSITLRYRDFRFPFHAPLDHAAAWLPAKVREAIGASEQTWHDGGQEFTFGGRPATWIEARAIPQDEIEAGLAVIYAALTGKGKHEFTALPPSHNTKTRKIPAKD